MKSAAVHLCLGSNVFANAFRGVVRILVGRTIAALDVSKRYDRAGGGHCELPDLHLACLVCQR